MFLRNGWYAAIWSRDLNEQPVGRTFLNEKVVLFRSAARPGRRAGRLLLPPCRAALARRTGRRLPGAAATTG